MNLKRHFILLLLISVFLSTIHAGKNPKNVIFMIGDGMGFVQIYAAMVASEQALAMEEFKHMGIVKTSSFNNFVTDSGAAGTALSTGVKTRNNMIGMGPDSVALETILQQAVRNGIATGIVASCAVTHATPASFIAHQINRNMYEEIAADYLKTDIDVFIGGGLDHFSKRKDGRNLLVDLTNKNYQLPANMQELRAIQKGKVAGLLYEVHPPAMPERGNFLPEATAEAIRLLSQHKKGFFMMVEGSQIDWAGHANDLDYNIRETIDFDNAVRVALEFARKDGNTLVIVTSDHETGGLTLPGGNLENRTLKGHFSTTAHSGEPVPVMAYGPGAEAFIGFMENIDFKKKIADALKLR